MFSLLFSLVYLALSSEVSTDQSSQGRAVVYGQVGAGGDCYLVSAKYQTTPAGGSGDVFAAAMGKNIGGFAYPWTALGYVRGSYDLDYYENKTLDQVTVDAQGAVVAWAFVAIGEFCDMNGKEGFQNNTSDFIISRFDAPLGAPFSQLCGVENDPVTNEQSYYSSIRSNGGNFNTTCRIFPRDTTSLRNGRKISRYQFKCDVRIDYSNLWAILPGQINGCPDSQRKIGVLVNIVGSAFDVDVTVDSRLNTRSGNVPDADSISFGSGKLHFGWDNYVVETPDGVATTGGLARVTYGYLKAGESGVTYQGASTVQQVIFSFGTPKSSGKKLFLLGSCDYC